MSTFVTKAEYLPKMRGTRLDQLTDNTDTLIDDVEETAIDVIKGYLHNRFDTDAIFSATGSNRSKIVIRWVQNLVLYYLHERIPGGMVPESVVKNYDDSLRELRDIDRGKWSPDLPRLLDSESEPKTRLRWGSTEKRSH